MLHPLFVGHHVVAVSEARITTELAFAVDWRQLQSATIWLLRELVRGLCYAWMPRLKWMPSTSWYRVHHPECVPPVQGADFMRVVSGNYGTLNCTEDMPRTV